MTIPDRDRSYTDHEYQPAVVSRDRVAGTVNLTQAEMNARYMRALTHSPGENDSDPRALKDISEEE